MTDIRKEDAKFYEAVTTFTEDIAFYKDHIPKSNATILELGCGTGRVTIPLAESCESIVGVDNSKAMLDLGRNKVADLAMPDNKIKFIHADITQLKLDENFGLVIAPFRVLQNLAIDKEVDGFFSVIKDHLSPEGFCILNVFNPKWQREELMNRWGSTEEELDDERPFKSGILKRYVVKDKFTENPFVLYPTMISRYFIGDDLQKETQFTIPMRVYYPDEFKHLIENYGFTIVDSWGGYEGEEYGTGTELVVKFRL